MWSYSEQGYVAMKELLAQIDERVDMAGLCHAIAAPPSS
jgi:hypothetical protein